jgi:hypothetical protein
VNISAFKRQKSAAFKLETSLLSYKGKNQGTIYKDIHQGTINKGKHQGVINNGKPHILYLKVNQ